MLPRLLDRPAEALVATGFPFENLDALEEIHKESSVDPPQYLALPSGNTTAQLDPESRVRQKQRLERKDLRVL